MQKESECDKMGKKKLDLWDTIGNICAWLYPIALMILVYILCYYCFMEENGMNDILRDVLVSIGTTIVLTAANYFILLKGMPDKIAEVLGSKLDRKMDPSNSELRAEQRQLQNTLKGEHSLLHRDHDKLAAEHEMLRGYLEAAAKQDAVAEARYQGLDASGRDIADAVRKLDAFSTAYQILNTQMKELQQRNTELERENAELKALSRSRERTYSRKNDLEI